VKSHFVSRDNIALLMICAKSEQRDLTRAERKALKGIIENWR